MAPPRRRGAVPARRKGRMVSIDFTGVEASGGGRLLPEGTYQFELVEVEEEVGQNSGEPYLAAVMKVTEGEYEGTKAYENFSLQPQSLWKLRSFLESAGYQTEDGPMDISYDDLIGLVGTADVIHEDYRGKTKHRINSWLIEGDGGQEERNDDERPTRGAAPSGGPRKRSNGSGRREETEDTNVESDWKVRDKVKFQDGKKTLSGVIAAIDDNQVTVKVGKDEYEMDVGDISAA